MPCHNACFSRAAPHPPRPLFLTLFGGVAVCACGSVFFFFGSGTSSLALVVYSRACTRTATAQHSTTDGMVPTCKGKPGCSQSVSRMYMLSPLSLLVQWILAFGLARDEDVRQSPVAVPSARPCTCTAQPITRRMPSRQSSGPGPGPDLMRTRSARGYGRHDCTRSIRAFSCHSTVKFAF